jgi:hypothetical protein
MDNLEHQVNDTEKRLYAHEVVCAERYEGIQDALKKGVSRMQKIEYLLYAVIGSVLLGPNFAAELIKKFIGG